MSANAPTPTGMLTRKIHCQLGGSCEDAAEQHAGDGSEPPIAPQAPSAVLRSLPSANVVVRIESAAGEMIAEPKTLQRA